MKPRFKKKLFLMIGVVLFGFLVTLPRCAVFTFKGYVVDAETREPLKDVVVLVEFDAVNPGGVSFYVDTHEGLTDEKGHFSIISKTKRLLFNLYPFGRNEFYIFKSGYVVIPGSWDNFYDLSYEPDISNYKVIWKVEHGQPYILLKKASMDREKRLQAVQSIHISEAPPERRKLMDHEIQKEYEIFIPCIKEKTC